MLRSLKDIERYTVTATDGDVGSVSNFVIDDERWIVRYLVVQPGHFDEGRRVLISPIFFRRAEWATHRFRLALTKDTIRKSPSVDVDKPVSRQDERDYYRYYGYPYYWAAPVFGALAIIRVSSRRGINPRRTERTHLRMPTCGAPKKSQDIAFREPMDRSVRLSTSSSKMRRGEFNTSWSTRVIGGSQARSPNWSGGRSESAGRNERFTSTCPEKRSRIAPWHPETAISREYEQRLPACDRAFEDQARRPELLAEHVVCAARTSVLVVRAER